MRRVGSAGLIERFGGEPDNKISDDRSARATDEIELSKAVSESETTS